MLMINTDNIADTMVLLITRDFNSKQQILYSRVCDGITYVEETEALNVSLVVLIVMLC